MALHRQLMPSLVLCSECVEKPENETRWSQYLDETSALLLRDVCAERHCPALRVRSSWCRDHALQAETTWQQRLPVKACADCQQDLPQLRSKKRDAWCITEWNDVSRTCRGAERKWRNHEDQQQQQQQHESPSPSRTKRARAQSKRRSARKGKSLSDKERQRALEWSLGEVPVNKLLLWLPTKDKANAEVEEEPAILTEVLEQQAQEKQAALEKKYRRPEPDAIFCAARGCRRFAKAGTHCLFHEMSTSFGSAPATTPAHAMPNHAA